MKRLRDMLVVGLIIAIVIGVTWFFVGTRTTFALATRNVEFIFRLTDSKTGDPVPRAEISIWTEDFRARQLKNLASLVTDEDGRAKILRENAPVEDVIRDPRH